MSASLTDLSSLIPLSPREIRTTITKNNPRQTINANAPLDKYLFAENEANDSIEFTDLLAVPVVISIIYFGSDAKDIAETPASLAPSITLIIVSATAFSSA